MHSIVASLYYVVYEWSQSLWYLPQPDFNSSSLFLALFTSSCLLTKLKKGFKKSKKCIVWLFYFHNFGQLIYSTHLTDLVDDSKQQQSVKNSDDD